MARHGDRELANAQWVTEYGSPSFLRDGKSGVEMNRK
jgi:hypothetical protein